MGLSNIPGFPGSARSCTAYSFLSRSGRHALQRQIQTEVLHRNTSILYHQSSSPVRTPLTFMSNSSRGTLLSHERRVVMSGHVLILHSIVGSSRSMSFSDTIEVVLLSIGIPTSLRVFILHMRRSVQSTIPKIVLDEFLMSIAMPLEPVRAALNHTLWIATSSKQRGDMFSCSIPPPKTIAPPSYEKQEIGSVIPSPDLATKPVVDRTNVYTLTNSNQKAPGLRRLLNFSPSPKPQPSCALSLGFIPAPSPFQSCFPTGMRQTFVSPVPLYFCKPPMKRSEHPCLPSEPVIACFEGSL